MKSTKSPNVLGGKAYEERSTLRQSRLVPTPSVLPVPRSGSRRPYVLQTRCAKGGEELTEATAWEHRRWTFDAGKNVYAVTVELLCTLHARQQKADYEGSR